MRYEAAALNLTSPVANGCSFTLKERLAVDDPMLTAQVRTGHMEWQSTVGRCTYAAVKSVGADKLLVGWMVFDREGGARFVAELVPGESSVSGTLQVYAAAASTVVLVTDAPRAAQRALRALPRPVGAMRDWEALSAAAQDIYGCERLDSVLDDVAGLAEAAAEGDRLMLQAAAVELRDTLLVLAATGGCGISIH